MPPFTGARTTGNVAAAQIDIDISDEIMNIDPSESPYTVLLKRSQEGGNKQAVGSSEFKWAEDDREERWDAINAGAGYAAGITTIVVDNGTRFYPGALVKIPRTGETIRVTAVATNSLTVTRGVSGSTAAAIVDDDPLLVMNYAADENSRAPAVRSENPNFVTNYTQIFKTTVGSSGTLRSTDNETTPHDWDHQKKKKHVEHMIDLEYAALFGKPSTVAGVDGPLRTTGGVLHYLTLNASAIGGVLTEAAWDTFLSTKAFAPGTGGSEKVLYASDKLIGVLMGFAKGRLDTTMGQSKYGVKYTDYISPFGTVSIVRHPLLEGAIYGGMGFVVDFKKGGFKYRYLNGGIGGSRDTCIKIDRQETDRDGRIDEIITEAGFQVALPGTGATITGVTG